MKVQMVSQIKVLVVRGILRSEDGDLQRECQLTVRQHCSADDDLQQPAQNAYSSLHIIDENDGWPPGAYEVTFEGQRVFLRKRGIHYVAGWAIHRRCR